MASADSTVATTLVTALSGSASRQSRNSGTHRLNEPVTPISSQRIWRRSAALPCQ